jgi:hypothetical protein
MIERVREQYRLMFVSDVLRRCDYLIIPETSMAFGAHEYEAWPKTVWSP